MKADEIIGYIESEPVTPAHVSAFARSLDNIELLSQVNGCIKNVFFDGNSTSGTFKLISILLKELLDRGLEFEGLEELKGRIDSATQASDKRSQTGAGLN
jgi:hypothetical protein